MSELIVRTLMARIAKGDEHAFAELYDELAPTLYGVVLRVVGDPGQSAEVTREACVRLWREAAGFDASRQSVRGWAVRIAHRCAVEHARSGQVRRRRQVDQAATQATAARSGQDTIIEPPSRGRARQILAQLGDSQRQALELAYFDALTHLEVAGQLGVTPGIASARIRDGLTRLRGLRAAPA
jgi:RNA polymerase sigma-70 factor, ECF subfamily